uniref:Uncharacterized protein n=1 Tax=viral metagenome TaxID=1070528 RepID=A0A6M3IS23_9ZZZZ
MPLSKERNRERMRVARSLVQPKPDTAIPKPAWLVQPNAYLSGHMAYCPDYNPVKPSDHWKHCPFISPMLRTA